MHFFFFKKRKEKTQTFSFKHVASMYDVKCRVHLWFCWLLKERTVQRDEQVRRGIRTWWNNNRCCLTHTDLNTFSWFFLKESPPKWDRLKVHVAYTVGRKGVRGGEQGGGWWCLSGYHGSTQRIHSYCYMEGSFVGNVSGGLMHLPLQPSPS